MKKKYITLEEVLALRGTDTKIYIDDVKDLYFMFSDNVLCCYTDKNELIRIGTTVFKDDKHYILEPEEFKVERTGKYLTRGGITAWVSLVKDDAVHGIMENNSLSSFWFKNGRFGYTEDDEINEKDLVEYVGD